MLSVPGGAAAQAPVGPVQMPPVTVTAADGAALHIPEVEFSGARLWAAIEGLVADPARLGALRTAARERGRPESARRIAVSLAALLPPPAGGVA